MIPKFTIIGAKKLTQKLAQIVQQVPLALGRAMLQEAEIELNESKKRVPVDTGTLRASGHVRGPEYQGSRVFVDITYGGAADDYALEVHEDLEMFHSVGQAKYLESVIVESAPHMASRLAKRLNIEELAK